MCYDIGPSVYIECRLYVLTLQDGKKSKYTVNTLLTMKVALVLLLTVALLVLVDTENLQVGKAKEIRRGD